MKTIDRGKLRRDARKGLLEANCNYHFTDDYLLDASRNYGYGDGIWRPVNLITCLDEFEHGKCNLRPSDFQSKVGRAWLEADNTITLIVHSNLSYSLRYREEGMK